MTNLHPEVERFLLAKFIGTEWTFFEVFQLGQALLDSINSTLILGHTKPGNTLDYRKEWHDDLATDLVSDFIAWTSGRQALRPGSEERIREYVVESGWQRHAMSRLGERMSPKPEQAAS